MKLLVTGTHGLLGQYLVRILSSWQGKVILTGRGPCRIPDEWMKDFSYAEMDITDPQAIADVFGRYTPDVVIHSAAEAQPDKCELDKEMADAVNVTSTSNLLVAAATSGAFFIYLSSDFIFPGEAGPYTEESEPGPVNYYGLTKLRSEELVKNYKGRWAIVRTVLVYGNTLVGTRTNIISWVNGELENGKPIKVVGDQVRTPTYAGDLAAAVLQIAAQRADGVWHISGKDVLTPHDIAIMVAERMGYDKALVTRVDASSFTQPAVRPLRTPFDISKAIRLLGYKPVSFREGMELVLH